MLFTNCLLSVWFVTWLAFRVSSMDVQELLMNFLMDEYDENAPDLPEGETQMYHLLCDHCKYCWWSSDGSPLYCPHCGVKL